MSTRADFGAPDEGLAAALAAWAVEPTPDAADQVHAALITARLLVPAIAARLPVDEPAADGAAGTAAGTMSLPTIIGRDGRAALPAFTSLDALTRWRADARPVPAAASDVLRAVPAEGCSALLIDVAGPVAFVLEGPVLDDLAAGYLPVDVESDELGAHTVEGGLPVITAAPAADPGLLEAIRAALTPEQLVVEAFLLGAAEGPGSSALMVGLVLAGPVDPSYLVALVRRVAVALAPAPALQEGLEIAVLTEEQRLQAFALGPPAYSARSGRPDADQ